MTIVWIILGVILMFLLSDYIWIIILAIAATLIAYYAYKAKVERDKAEREWEIKKAENEYSKDPTHTNFYKATTPQPAPFSDVLNTFKRYAVTAPSIYQGCPMVYMYPNISVSNVNKDCLRTMVNRKDFEVVLYKGDLGEIFIKKYGITIAKLEDKAEMCSDWIDKGLPLICQFAAFQNGKEKVALFFYKDQESALANNKCDIVKLASCMSAEKQEIIAFLEKGQKLFIELDDNNKPYVRDIEYNPIGRLPAKYQRLYEEELICGIFFDHSEKKVSEDLDEDDKEIPFVRIYLDE